jgi:hypothetical protein
MSIDLKPNSLELGSSFTVLNLGSSRKPTQIKSIFKLLKYYLNAFYLNKPHLLRCGTRKVFLMAINTGALYPGLEGEVNDYLINHIHKGFIRPFGGLKRLDTSEVTLGVLQVIPKGLEEEDLSDIDPNFNQGLLAIGAKYHLCLRLPYWAYAK